MSSKTHKMFSLYKLLTLVILLLSLGLVLPQRSVLAISYGGIGGKPAYPKSDNPRSESIFVYTAEPGSTINEGVLVVNSTKEDKILTVYGADSTPSTDGGFACEQMSEEKNSVGKWLNLSKNEVSLKPITNEIVPFTISIPQDVEPGEHNGCILVQEVKPNKDNEGGISLSFRTGIRVAITIPGNITRQLELLKFEVSKGKGDRYIIRPQIANKGNVSLATNVTVTVKNLTGKIIKTFGGNYPILREDTSIWNYEFAQPLFGGIYKTQLTAVYNNGTEDVKIETKELTFIAVPTQKGFIIIGLAVAPLVAFITFLLIKGFFYKKSIQNWVDYTVKSTDNLQGLAELVGGSWKLIAKANKIKSPYVLKSGQKIKLPPMQL